LGCMPVQSAWVRRASVQTSSRAPIAAERPDVTRNHGRIGRGNSCRGRRRCHGRHPGRCDTEPESQRCRKREDQTVLPTPAARQGSRRCRRAESSRARRLPTGVGQRPGRLECSPRGDGVPDPTWASRSRRAES
jgi:hypothetical protein